ncbi:L,D-transpeptidase family protein [uncultured Roseibium sp.]|uniref:L,D-transpeptidase family protein n=1 Tax=uncultured Roseibium sp. TaxID=1936171 RepID=UPI0032167F21
MKKTLFALVLAVAVSCGLTACERFWPETPLKAGARADRVVVFKGERVLELMAGDVTLKRYTVSLGREPVGAKQREGDGRTPEGRYRIDYRNPASGYHLALHISYPDAQDRARARKAGVSPGGDIMIHGMRNGYGWIGSLHRLVDWTNGCIAVTDTEMDEIWRAVANGTEIEIRP